MHFAQKYKKNRKSPKKNDIRTPQAARWKSRDARFVRPRTGIVMSFRSLLAYTAVGRTNRASLLLALDAEWIGIAIV